MLHKLAMKRSVYFCGLFCGIKFPSSCE